MSFLVTVNATPSTGGGNSGGSGSGSKNTYTPSSPKSNDPTPSQTSEVEEPINPPVLETLNHIKYISGYTDGTVGLDKYMTRAESTQMFFNLITDSQKHTHNIISNFSDVEIDAWYARAVSYLTETNIISGYTDGTFNPAGQITRAEFAALASRFDVLIESIVSTPSEIFTDVSNSHWAIKYIDNAYTRNWITGYPDGTFRPNAYITRAEVVTLVNRVLDRKIQLEDIPNWITDYADITSEHWAYTDIIEASTEHEYSRTDNSEIWREYMYTR